MNSRPTGINSGDVSPDIKQKQDAGQSQTQWAKQLAQKFAADAAGQRYGGQVT